MGLANKITISRGLLTLALWVLLVVGATAPSQALWVTALVVYVVAALTDAVDGAIARRRHEVSVFGRVVDPLVDKLLTLSTLVLLLGIPEARAVLPPWAVVVLLARELLVTTLRSAVESRGENFQAVAIGKLKMVVQSMAVGAVLMQPLGWGWVCDEISLLAGLPGGPWNLAHVLVWLAVVITVASGWTYARRAMGLLEAA